jgi:hypothetical protein
METKQLSDYQQRIGALQGIITLCCDFGTELHTAKEIYRVIKPYYSGKFSLNTLCIALKSKGYKSKKIAKKQYFRISLLHTQIA